MAKQPRTAIEPTREQDYPEWYQQVIKAADLAETSPVRGCMVIKPWGYTLWENMQRILDGKFKATGHTNAYFPLFIPLSYLEKEAQHVDGFAKECAVVTHHRLVQGPDGKLIPDGKLDEPLIVRPTSETIIGETYAKWVQSYRDLPILINQWANVVRWEMRPRLFLRTAEFLWQEGHTVHATQQEAEEETARMLGVYAEFAEKTLAIPVIQGEKTESERFPGAVATWTIEAMMQDRKALQSGTSHFLGQNFAKASGITYQSADGVEETAWTTSWGVSTRLIGGLIMTHADDDGMILPPRVASSHVVLLPVTHKEETKAAVLEHTNKVATALRAQSYMGRPVEVIVDDRDGKGGEKNWHWVKRGIPVRVEIGPREVDEDKVFVARRDKGPKDKASLSVDEFASSIADTLDDIQSNLLKRARAFRKEHTHSIDTKEEFYAFFTPKNKDKPEIHGGFVMAHWNGSAEVEKQIQDDLKVTIRCIPVGDKEGPGTCPFSGEPSKQRVVFAKSY